MNSVKSWVVMLCLISVFVTLTELIMPNGKMEKVIRLVLGTFMVCAIISPISSLIRNVDFDFRDIASEVSVYEQKTDEDALNMAKANIRDLVTKLLEQNGIKPQRIEINMDKNEMGSIDITKITVYLFGSDRANATKAQGVIKDNFNIETEVKVV